MVRYENVKLAELDLRYAALRLVRPDVLASVRRSIERHGVLHPIVVNVPTDGRRVVLDGFKRLSVLRELGRTDVMARFVSLEDAAAQAAMITSNTPHRGMTEIEEAWVVRSLVRSCKLKQSVIADLIGRHKSWVSRRLLLAEALDPAIQEDMRLGLIGATIARELARLPRGNQTAVAESIRHHGLTTRQAVILVTRCLLSASEEATAKLLADPLLFLEHSDPMSTPADPRLGERGERIRRDLIRLEEAAKGICYELRKHPFGGLRTCERTVLHEAISATRLRTNEALTLLSMLEHMSMPLEVYKG